MNVLIACEYSGVVRRAFRALGHNAWSCDLLDSEDDSLFHVKGDIFNYLDICKTMGLTWDLMIAHPPCTYLTTAAEWAYSDGPYHQKLKLGTLVGEARREARREALEFVRKLMVVDIPRICIENPISCISTCIRKPDQIIQPWYFGDDASKKTCLWLKNLPLLKDTNRLLGDNKTRRANQTPSGQNKLGPSKDRAKIRSRTYNGIAEAMANQWSIL